MGNPSPILVDSDCLIQIFLARQRRLLPQLRSSFSVETAVVAEVEAEVRFHRKFKSQFEPELLRAVQGNEILVLENKTLRRYLADRGFAEPRAARIIQDVDDRGLLFSRTIGLGEAYTHAAASILQLPVMSHDRAATNELEREGNPTGVPVVGFFDLLALAYSEGWLDEGQCEGVRKFLAGRGEFVPRCFRKTSFAAGLTSFRPRLVRCATTPVPACNSGDVLELVS